MTQPASRPRGSRRGLIGSLVALLCGVLLVVFFVANTQPVRVHFVIATLQTSLIWALIVSGVLGFAVGVLAPLIIRRARRG